ncbi:MAG: hypothetical protein IKL10_07605 [Clostridia bacterium]|nr:hypothetical protein [Clostridia bacterium]
MGNVKSQKKLNKPLKILISVLTAFLLFVGFLLFMVLFDFGDEPQTYETDNPYIVEYGKTMTSAHRSGAGIFPENTMMAFEGCINSDEFKTDIFEFDLHITKDSELILLHDSTLDRTTDAEEVFDTRGVRPENYTYEELRQINFGDGFKDEKGEYPYKGLKGEAVPENLKAAKLQDVLEYLGTNGDFRYIIEIKNGGELGFKATDILYEVLSEMNMLDMVVVGTFNGEVSRYITDNYPLMHRSAGIFEVVVVYIASLFNFSLSEDFFTFSALQVPHDTPIIDLCTPRFCNYAHKNNLAVQYWTVNDAEKAVLLEKAGADCVMSDIPDVVYEVLNTDE